MTWRFRSSSSHSLIFAPTPRFLTYAISGLYSRYYLHLKLRTSFKCLWATLFSIFIFFAYSSTFPSFVQYSGFPKPLSITSVIVTATKPYKRPLFIVISVTSVSHNVILSTRYPLLSYRPSWLIAHFMCQLQGHRKAILSFPYLNCQNIRVKSLDEGIKKAMWWHQKANDRGYVDAKRR